MTDFFGGTDIEISICMYSSLVYLPKEVKGFVLGIAGTLNMISKYLYPCLVDLPGEI